MRITGLDLSNWLLHRHLSLSFAPLTLICGPNEAGKSAIADAIAFAMLAELRRIGGKSERDQLLSTGAKSGHVTIRCGEGEEAMQFSRDIATGAAHGAGVKIPVGESAVTAAVSFLLDIEAFARAPIDERRRLLFAVMRIPADPASLIKTLSSRGHSGDLLGDLPLTEGVEQWRDRCARGATEARGAWKAVTRETYGSVKAETWTAAAPEGENLWEEFEATRVKVVDLEATRGTLQQALGAARERLAQTVASAARVQTSMVLSVPVAAPPGGPLVHILTCVRCGQEHVYETPALKAYVRPASPTVLTAPAPATAPPPAPAAEDPAADAERARLQGEIDVILARIDAVNLEIGPLNDQRADLWGRIEASKRALEATERAKDFHEKVKGWTALAEALAPSGIPGELLEKALSEFNGTLAAVASGVRWSPVTINGIMEIRRGGVPYMLLSKSARWRCNVMIAAALAEHSGLRFMIVDEFDILEISARGPMLKWSYEQIKSGRLDTLILLGTLREIPQLPSDIKAIWLGPPGV